MKTSLSILAVIALFSFGYIIGSNRTETDKVVSDTVQKEESKLVETKEDEYEFAEDEASQSSKSPVRKKKKLTRKKRLEKGLKYFMSNAPFSLVKKLYQKQTADLEKAAFGGVYSKGDWRSDENKDHNQSILEQTKNMFKKGFYYTAEGTISYAGHNIPYEFLINFDAHGDSTKTPEAPKKPHDINYMLDVSFDTSKVGFGSDNFTSSMGSGIYGIYKEGGQVFTQLYLYYQDRESIFNDILYILVGVPTTFGKENAIRLFDSKNKKWIEVSDELRWKLISQEEVERLQDRLRGSH